MIAAKPPAKPDQAALPGSTAQTQIELAAGLQAQLLRYADDMRIVLESQASTEQRLQTLSQAYGSVVAGHAVARELIQSSRDMFFVTRSDGNVISCNDATTLIAHSAEILGAPLASIIAASHQPQFEALLTKCKHGGQSTRVRLEIKIPTEPGVQGTCLVEVSAHPVRIEGTLHFIYWLFREIAASPPAEPATPDAIAAGDSSTDSVMVASPDGNILAVNQKFTGLTGYTAEEVVGRNPRFLKSGTHTDNFYKRMWHSIYEKGIWQGRICNLKKDGSAYTTWLALSAMKGKDGTVLSYVATYTDLTPMQLAEERLSEAASPENLPQMPSLRLLQDRLQHLLVTGRRNDQPCALFYLRLGGFSDLSRSRGFMIGDAILNESAKRILATLGQSGSIALFGPGDFVILAPSIRGEAEATDLAAKLTKSLAKPFVIAGQSLTIEPCIGGALYPEHGDRWNTLLDAAMTAMHDAMRSGARLGFTRPQAPPAARVQPKDPA